MKSALGRHVVPSGEGFAQHFTGFHFLRGSPTLTLLRQIARLLASRAKRSLFAYEGRTDVELKPCRYCNNWVRAEKRVCTHFHAIFAR